MSSDTAPREVPNLAPSNIKYSICSLVTDSEEYNKMVMSLRSGGFSDPDCEYLFVNNKTSNQMDAFSAYNRFLLEAQGTYIILCHQDIVLLQDGRSRLDFLLDDLTKLDPRWGLCGNAGAKADGSMALCITDPHETSGRREGGPFPVPVASLDENFIVAKREANLALSSNISGFHWYGADLCLIASILGYNSYVVDFHLKHKSGGNLDESFHNLGKAFRRKYAQAFRPRWHYVTTEHPQYLSSSSLKVFFMRLFRKIRRTVFTRSV